MTILVNENDDVLYQATDEWDFSNPPEDADSLVPIMFATMRMERGVGLAAPQIGKSYRVFVMGTEENFRACFNPKILNASEKLVAMNEGCLSFPGLTLKVKRPAIVDVEYQNTKGEVVVETLDGLWARCFQHELDHLNGICFIDKVGKMTLTLAENRRNKALKGKGK